MSAEQGRIIKNYDELLSHGQRKAREDALKIIEAGVNGGDPGVGTRRQVRLAAETFCVADNTYDLNAIDNIYVVGAGKGSFPIAQALEEILGSLITTGVVVTKRGETRRLRKIEILEAGHPIPDEGSLTGARRILEITRRAGARDLVFAAVTGGASALVTLPPAGIPLHAIQQATDLLLKSGAVIREINTVRKHLCRMKGGRLVASIQPAEAITLTLNTNPDGMPWPDMCLADPSTFQEAIDVLHHYELWDQVSRSIQDYLLEGVRRPDLETLKSLAGMRSRIISVGDPPGACQAAALCAEELGYQAVILGTNLEGEARDVGVCFAGIAEEIINYGRPFTAPCVLISGGETTVTVKEDNGKGGPNQEFVLGFIRKFRGETEIACAAVDTDGTDGPTEIAGGIVDNLTPKEADASQINIAKFLKNHDSSEALLRLKGAIITGNTGTNVLNLRVIVIR